MKAIVASQYGPADVLQLQEVEKPTPRDHELLIKVRAATVNAGDIRMRRFDVPPLFWLPARLTLGLTRPKHPIYGMELAGEVEAVGRNVTKFKPGDPVIASTFEANFGAHAEYKCLPEEAAIILKPARMGFEEAVTLPISAYTALHFLKAADIRAGQNVLIYGASGGVGTFAVQIAKYFGAEVTAVCSTRNVALVQSLGADHVVDYTKADFTKTGILYDIIFDTVGKTTFAQCQNSLKGGGFYLHTVMVLPELKRPWYARRTGKQVVGGTAVPKTEGLTFLSELMAAGQIRPVIDRCYPLAETAEAHRFVEGGHKRGSVVIKVG